MHVCVCVHRYLWWDTEGVQSGISFAVMTHGGGIPQPPRQNSPSVAARGTKRSEITHQCECGCGVCVCVHSHLSLQ